MMLLIQSIIIYNLSVYLIYRRISKRENSKIFFSIKILYSKVNESEFSTKALYKNKSY